MEERALQLAKFVSSVKYDDVPEEAVEAAKRFVLDFARLAVVGSRLEWGTRTRDVFHAMGGTSESTVLAFGDRLPAINAAYVNGVMSHGLENDDTHVGSIHHPGVTVIPAVLATAERQRAGGREFVAGVIVGYEVMIRLGLAMQPSLLRDRGFHSTAVLGHFGAAAGASRMLGLSSDQVASALGLAASYASGLNNWLSGGMVKFIHAGKAAKAGVEAALLASTGVTGPREVFEGGRGFCHGYADSYNLDAITEGLGSLWRTPEVHLKPHCTSRHTQSAIEGVAAIAAEHDIRADQVESVHVRTSEQMAATMYNMDPLDVIQAQANIPFAVGTALVKGGRRTLKEYLLFEDMSQGMGDPQVRDLAARVRLEGDPSFSMQQGNAEVTISLKDGRRLTRRVDVIRGSPEDPFSTEELRDRFLSQAGQVLPRERLVEAADIINDLEQLEDIGRLTRLLC